MIPMTKPLLGKEEQQAIQRVLQSGWVTQGPEVEAFEQDFCSLTGSKNAIAVSNCTTALHLALLALNIGPGDEVITVSHTFIATANAIIHAGATPVFIDIDPTSYNMNPDLIEAAITDRTRAILCVHQMGMPCDLDAILNIARKFELKVIEDAACAIGSEILWKNHWEPIGKPHGDIACFSFHPRKILTTGDGGMLTTQSDELDKRLRLLRHQGMSVSDRTRHQAQEVIFESYPLIGYNYRLTDIQAAIGRVQLSRLPGMIERRQLIYQWYEEELQQHPKFTLPINQSWTRTNWQSFCLKLPPELKQKQVMNYLLKQGISSRRGIMNCHLEAAYQEKENCRISQTLFQSEQAQQKSILLPFYGQMSREDVSQVCQALNRL